MMALPVGALQALEKLDRMKNYNISQTGKAMADDIALLRTQLLRLQERKAELSSKTPKRKKILCDKFLTQPVPLTPGESEDFSQKERILEKECEMKRMQALAAAHRLTGLSCEVLKTDSGSHLLLRWHPSYLGLFMEPYTAQVQMAPVAKIIHHSFPVFMPLQELERSLSVSVQEFGTQVRKYLQAFVARRHTALLLKECLPAEYYENEVHTTAAANCVQLELCNLRPPLTSISILLIYDDLKKFHVTRVAAKSNKKANEDVLAKLTVLREKLLKEDVVECIKKFVLNE